jgi:D-3-phosphoglycerate dehydrogenase
MKKKIIVITPVVHLDGVVELLKTKGQVYFEENISKIDLRNFLLKENIDTIVCNPNKQDFKIDKELLVGTKIKIINSCSTGLNHIDVDYCMNNNIIVQSHKNDLELINELPSTAELAFGLMCDLMRHITNSNNIVHSTKEWDYTKFVGNQIKGSNIGILGFGRLGKMMYKFCKAFDANLFVYDPYLDDNRINCSSISELFMKSDIISIHVHVTDETKAIINHELLEKEIKYLVNTSRGEIINENDVITALKNKKLLGYATDVLESEFDDIKKSKFFLPENKKLNLILTPHVGGMTIEGQTKAYIWSINKL